MRKGISYIVKDIVKQIINTFNQSIIVSQVNISHIQMQIIYVVGQ